MVYASHKHIKDKCLLSENSEKESHHRNVHEKGYWLLSTGIFYHPVWKANKLIVR